CGEAPHDGGASRGAGNDGLLAAARFAADDDLLLVTVAVEVDTGENQALLDLQVVLRLEPRVHELRLEHLPLGPCRRDRCRTVSGLELRSLPLPCQCSVEPLELVVLFGQ